MHRHAVAVVFLLAAISAAAQSFQSQLSTVSDPLAISLAKKSATALSGKSSVMDVTLYASVDSILGSDYETGTATLRANGIGESRVDLNLSGGTRSEVRSIANGSPTGRSQTNGKSSSSYAQHNCWTDAAWFFPALSSLAQPTTQSFIFKYVAQEQYNGITAQHIQVYQVSAINPYLPRLSAMDFYLDATSLLPLGVTFATHPDWDMNVDIASEIRFANYHQVNGIAVPFHIQRLINGSLVLDATVTSAAVNSGLATSLFSLP